MSILKATTIEPATGTNVTLGTTGDSVALPGNTVVLDTWKDSGGNTLFTSNGSGTVSSVNSGLAGAGPVLIQSQTATNSANISFTSGIDSTYDKYMFVYLNINAATDQTQFTFQVNASGQTGFNEYMTSTFFRAYHTESGSGSDISYSTNSDQENGNAYQMLTEKDQLGNGADESASGCLYLFNPSSTTYLKQFYGTSSLIQYSGAAAANNGFVSGYINTSSAITEVDFKINSGNFDGIIKLYGVT